MINFMKKKHIYAFCAVSTLLSFSACEIHDPVDDLAAIGQQVANVYWELPNLLTNAGDSVAFKVQYWSIDDSYEYLGVWYDIQNNYTYSVTNSAFSHTLSVEAAETGRELQEIINFSDEHSSALWNDSLSAYVFEAKFPVSHTLTGSMISNPIEFTEAAAAIKAFPKTFETEFKEGLFPKLLVVADSSKVMKLLTVDFPRTDTLTVRSFYKVEFDENAGTNVTVITEAAKDQIKNYLSTIPLDSLTYNSVKLMYELNYKKNFKLNARFKVVNGSHVGNFSDPKEITVD